MVEQSQGQVIELTDQGRLNLLDACLGLLKKEQDDPRAAETIAHYEAQREELVARIRASNPPPVVISASVGMLDAKKRG